ncbi:MAG: methyl-accepting chemotaxis protein [Planctomycetota bacterium]|nr:methyl-accepting chemotaxis protein [Planctomycetota bacterium]
MTFKKRFVLIGALFVVGYAAMLLISWGIVEEVRIGGATYEQVVTDKDVIADVLPPPRFMIEPYLLCYEIATTDNAMDRGPMIMELKASFEMYDERGAYWAERIDDPKLRKLLLETSAGPVREFQEIVENEFLPALKGEGDWEPLDVITSRLEPLFSAHKAAVKQTVAVAEQRIRSNEQNARDAVERGRLLAIIVAGAFGVLLLGAGLWTGRAILARMRRINTRVRELAEADANLAARLDMERGDEVGELAGWFDRFLEKIAGLVKAVQRSSVQLTSTATQMAATSHEQEATINRFGASTTQIAAATKEISATGVELMQTMGEVGDVARESADVATAGRESLSGMQTSMGTLADSSASISTKLSVINEKAADIGVVVTTITKVADQTNLLSVNAAIEAEKAGEYGKGFLVVAREIRRLADQTAGATLDIEQTVGEMQSAVSAGVMEMDKFTEQVRSSVDRVRQVSGQLGRIIEQVEVLTTRFDLVREGMTSQSEGAMQINDAMGSLSDSVRQTTESLGEFTSVAESLKDAMQGLKGELSAFRLEE